MQCDNLSCRRRETSHASGYTTTSRPHHPGSFWFQGCLFVMSPHSMTCWNLHGLGPSKYVPVIEYRPWGDVLQIQYSWQAHITGSNPHSEPQQFAINRPPLLKQRDQKIPTSSTLTTCLPHFHMPSLSAHSPFTPSFHLFFFPFFDVDVWGPFLESS